MAIQAYARVKLFWGAVDIIHANEPHTPQETHPMGEDANPPGIGVRRAQIVWARDAYTPAEDVIVSHFDIQNFTSGAPDDTWVEADFTYCEQEILRAFQAVIGDLPTPATLKELRWYRIGPGILPPNPAIRITPLNVAGTGSSKLPPQVAMTVTLRTGVQRSWGRMYLPLATQAMVRADGRIIDTAVDNVSSAFNTLVSNLAVQDFLAVVFSKTRQKAYSVEHIQVDNLWDVIRSRRYHAATHKAIHP